MRIKKLNVLIFFGFFAIIGVIIMQLFLLSTAYTFEKKEMENKIHFALKDVAQKIYRDNNTLFPVPNPVKKIADSYYIVNVNNVFENNILEHYLKSEFDKVKLDLDFEYAIYDCGTDDMVYGNYISAKGKSQNKCRNCFTKNSDLTYYFGIRFPKLQQNYFSSLRQFWIYTVVLIAVLIIYVYSVVLFLQQKRYTELQTDFINNMTHEFKTPLSSILIASNYAHSQNEIKENPKLSRYIKIIIDQSNKLNQHIEQILSLAKTDSQKIDLQRSEVNLYETLELVKDNIALKYNKKAVFTIDNSCQAVLSADAFHFYNLIYNLADNAVKYGAELPEINISLIRNTKTAFLRFMDSGGGIPEKDLPFIFDKFYRVKRKDEVEGFGIGLAYVKKIAELHRWKITAQNTAFGLQTDIEIPITDLVIK